MVVLQQKPVVPGPQLLLLGNQKISDISYKLYDGHPRFYRFKSLGSLQFSSEYSLTVPVASSMIKRGGKCIFVSKLNYPCTVFSIFDMNQLRNNLFTDPPFIFLSHAPRSLLLACSPRSRACLALAHANVFQKNKKKNKTRSVYRLRKIRQHRQKEHLKISRLAKFWRDNS